MRCPKKGWFKNLDEEVKELFVQHTLLVLTQDKILARLESMENLVKGFDSSLERSILISLYGEKLEDLEYGVKILFPRVKGGFHLNRLVSSLGPSI